MTTYRTDDRIGFHPICFRALDGCKTIYSPADRPDDHRVPYGEWYCRNEGCVVREVRIRSKLLERRDQVPAMRCPGCGAPLAFHHWLASETLLRVPEGETTPTTPPKHSDKALECPPEHHADQTTTTEGSRTMSTRNTYTTSQVREIQQAAKGRWREILHHVGGLPLEILDGERHDCPLCKGQGTFRLVSNDTGEVECTNCFPRNPNRN